MHGPRTHKGVAKRVRITRNGQVKHKRAGGRHRKNRHTSKQNLQLRRPKYAPEVERKRVQRMINFTIRRPEQEAQSKAKTESESAQD